MTRAHTHRWLPYPNDDNYEHCSSCSSIRKIANLPPAVEDHEHLWSPFPITNGTETYQICERCKETRRLPLTHEHEHTWVFPIDATDDKVFCMHCFERRLAEDVREKPCAHHWLKNADGSRTCSLCAEYGSWKFYEEAELKTDAPHVHSWQRLLTLRGEQAGDSIEYCAGCGGHQYVEPVIPHDIGLLTLAPEHAHYWIQKLGGRVCAICDSQKAVPVCGAMAHRWVHCKEHGEDGEPTVRWVQCRVCGTTEHRDPEQGDWGWCSSCDAGRRYGSICVASDCKEPKSPVVSVRR